MKYCPNCRNQVTSASVASCLSCGAQFGPGSAWQPVSSFPAESEGLDEGTVEHSIQSLFVAPLYVFGVLLAVSAVLVPSQARVLLLAPGAFFCGFAYMLQTAKSNVSFEKRMLAAIFGALLFIGLLAIVGSVVGALGSAR